MHRRLKAALVARKSSSSWPTELPWVLLGLRSVPLEASGVSAAELVLGSPLSLPGQFLSTPELPPSDFLDQLHRLVDPFQPPPLVHDASPPSGVIHLPPALWEAEFVFVRRDGTKPPLTPIYDGPYRVLHRTPAYFRLAIGGNEDTVSVARLKPVLASGPVLPAQPRRRGRPPRQPRPPGPPRRRGRPPREPRPPTLPRPRGRPRGIPPTPAALRLRRPVSPPPQLRRGRSRGLDHAVPGQPGLGGGPVEVLEPPVFPKKR